MKIIRLGFLSFSLLLTSSSQALVAKTKSISAEDTRPLALIYKGWGSCNTEEGDAGDSGYGCSEASAVIAEAAGFRFKYVTGDALPENATDAQVKAVFEDAKVWIQPGGVAVTAFFTMTYKLRTEIVKFVNEGGGYVGFCAGAFMATAAIGQTRYAGFGIFPGYTALYWGYPDRYDIEYSFKAVSWKGQKRSIYYEGGPYLGGFSPKDQVEVIGVYADGYTAAARAHYGHGRVFISGPHPEAPSIWSAEDQMVDPDGSDTDLAVDMVKWASGLE